MGSSKDIINGLDHNAKIRLHLTNTSISTQKFSYVVSKVENGQKTLLVNGDLNPGNSLSKEDFLPAKRTREYILELRSSGKSGKVTVLWDVMACYS